MEKNTQGEYKCLMEVGGLMQTGDAIYISNRERIKGG